MAGSLGGERALCLGMVRAETRSERWPNPANALHGRGSGARSRGPVAPVAGTCPGVEVLA